MTMATVGSAVQAACLAAREEAVRRAISDDRSALRGVNADASRCATGGFTPQRRIGGPDLRRAGALGDGQPIEAEASSARGDEGNASRCMPSARCSPSAVDPDLGTSGCGAGRRLRAGRIVNPRLARSQCIGGMVGGIGMALMEQTVLDPRDGRPVNASMADYLVPVNRTSARSRRCSSTSDPHVNPLGSRGWARSRSSAWRRPSPTRSSTPPGAGCATCRSASRTCSNRVRRCSRPRNERMPLTQCLCPRRHCLPSENPENAPVADRTVPRLGSGGP